MASKYGFSGSLGSKTYSFKSYNPRYDVALQRDLARKQAGLGGGGRGRARAGAVEAPAAKKPTLPGAARTAWEQAIAGYGPEGGYGKGVEAGLERSRTKAVASGMQSLVGAGLAGTTMAAGLGKKFEEEVATPARARVEETRAAAVANLRAGLAGAEQRGYETAEDRALRERLANLQVSSQEELARLGYENQERLSSRDLAMQEVLASMKTQGTPGGAGGPTDFYGEEDPGFGGVAEPEVRGAGGRAGTYLTAAGGRGRGSQVYTDMYQPATTKWGTV